MSCFYRLEKKTLALLKWLFLAVLVIFSLSSLNAKAETIHFDLFDPNGPVTQDSYPGKFLLLAIGYSSCPDICPTTLYEYGYAMKHLKHADHLQPLFVTIDPVNDEINRLNAYTQYFDERIIGLSGDMENIEALARQLGATFGYRLDGRRISHPEPGMAYTVYHSAMIYLINPEGELVDVFDYQIGGDDLVQSVDAHLEEALNKS